MGVDNSDVACSRCGGKMMIAHRSKNQVLYKCKKPNCGHMTLVQEWDRDDVGRKESGH
ncbi:hypothetical protein LCGC14_0591400 [marine sediment metagenome]|uniref:Uncharacterized protein n=1 Tax=marine sediment metagenome TaxID=412755 RepID=A0A0F9ULV9_9ZZZZ